MLTKMRICIAAVLFALIVIVKSDQYGEFDLHSRTCVNMLENKLKQTRDAPAVMEKIIVTGNSHHTNPLAGQAKEKLVSDCSHYSSKYFWQMDQSDFCRDLLFDKIDPKLAFYQKYISRDYPMIDIHTRLTTSCQGVLES